MKISIRALLKDLLAGPGASAGFKFRALTESLVFLTIGLLINVLFFRDDLGFLNLRFHPYWLIAILIPIRYGFKEGLVCTCCAGCCYFLFAAIIKGSYDLTYPLLFLLMAGILGQNRDVLDRNSSRLQTRLNSMSASLDAYKKNELAYQDTINHFERNIVTQFSNAMDMFRELSATKALTAEEMKSYLLVVLKKYLQIRQCAYYEVTESGCRKKYSTELKAGEEEFYPLEEDLILLQAYRTKKFVYLQVSDEKAIQQLARGKCLLAGPILSRTGEIRALVGISALPFSHFNTHSFQLFTSLLEVWGSVIEDKLQLEGMQAKNIIEESTGIYKYHYFEARIGQEFRRAQEFAIPLSVSLLHLIDYATIAAEKKANLLNLIINSLRQKLSEMDMISAYQDPATIAVIHPFHLQADAEKQITELITEIKSYDLTPYPAKEKSLVLCHATGDFQVGMESCRDFIAGIEKELVRQIDSCKS